MEEVDRGILQLRKKDLHIYGLALVNLKSKPYAQCTWRYITFSDDQNLVGVCNTTSLQGDTVGLRH